MYNIKHKKMAKIYGLFGTMTGKVADTVMSVRNGEQIVRRYQPVVLNPNTTAQVQARAKLKLVSQLSAVLAPGIAFRRQGAVSARNLFVKENYKLTTYSNGEASIILDNVKLTKSVLALPPIQATRDTSNTSVGIVTNDGVNVSRVVYIGLVKQPDNTLRYSGTRIASAAGTGNTWSVQFPNSRSECVFYAYGVRDNTEAARVIFGDMETIPAEQVAKLITSSTLLETDVSLTETRGVTLEAQP